MGLSYPVQRDMLGMRKKIQGETNCREEPRSFEKEERGREKAACKSEVNMGSDFSAATSEKKF